MPSADVRQRGIVPLSAGFLGAWAVIAVILALSVGRGADPIAAIELIPQIGQWAAPGLVYLASAVGYGLLLARLTRGAADQAPLIVGLGIAMLAAISQVAGCLGLLANTSAAIALLLPGWAALGVLLWCRRRERLEIPHPGVLAWVAVVPIAVLIAAASAPPGWLWDSEYGGFDALSYHLQLPQEWLARGRLEPLEHNVYSFLPGSLEAAVLHIAAFTSAPNAEAAPAGFGLLAGTGWRAIASQYLHAWHTLLACWLVARATRSVAMASGASQSGSRRAGVIAGVLLLATPWTVVVGSLSYSEMPVVGLGAAAVVAAIDDRLSPIRRGLLAGALVGAACGFKPTAMTFLTPGIGLVLLLTRTPREWLPTVVAGSLAGLALLAPWMIRNWLASGNPVFPFATSLFDSAHWSAEQAQRYAAGHAFDGSLLDRLRLLIAPDPDAPATARDVQRWRGLLNPQYAALFPAAIGALVGLTISSLRSRCPTLLMGGMLTLGLLAWLLTTHLQARFLLPLALPACVLAGLALGADRAEAHDRSGPSREWAFLAPRLRQGIAALLVCAQAISLVVIFSQQRGGGPNEATTAGTAILTGEFLTEPHESPAATINRSLPAGSSVYLVGDAAPFYLTARRPSALLWHTTWDASPLGEAIRAHGEDPAAWTAALRARGVTHVLLNFPELTRYQRSGWYDPDATPARITAWVNSLGNPLLSWDRTGQALFSLSNTPGAPADD